MTLPGAREAGIFSVSVSGMSDFRAGPFPLSGERAGGGGMLEAISIVRREGEMICKRKSGIGVLGMTAG